MQHKSVRKFGSTPKRIELRYSEFKKLMLENNTHTVLSTLEPHVENRDYSDKDCAPVQYCYNYINNRYGQFNYEDARSKGLPIGSGEMESSHKHIIKSRLNITGAYWKEANAQKMISLRQMRANDDWDSYWHNYMQVAA